jgi:outer membrane lipoprotein
MKSRLYPICMGLLLLLTGCQSSIPLEIRQSLPGSPDLAQVRGGGIESFQGARVRWGGVIVLVENKADETWVEVAARELGSYGRPAVGDISPGRFIARVEGFLDPAVYRADRQLTVYGVVESAYNRAIGERPYSYPVIKVERLYLWPEYLRQNYYYPPLFPYYDPFYYYPRRFFRPYYPGFFPYW